MAQEPSDDDVSNLCAIADISEAQYGKVVLNALRNSSNNQNQVMMEIFDDLEAFVRKNTWDESAFGANREGETNSAGIGLYSHAAERLGEALTMWQLSTSTHPIMLSSRASRRPLNRATGPAAELPRDLLRERTTSRRLVG